MGPHTVIFAFLCLGLAWETHGQAMSDEKRLIHHMLENYSRVGKIGRPVAKANETLMISFDLTLLKLLKLDENRQTISLLGWYKLQWKDMLLQWDPTDFGNVDTVRIPANDIYTPDIMPFMELPAETTVKDVMVAVKPDGTVIWVPPVQMTTLCSDMVPGMERITCDIKIGSWTQSGYNLDIEEKDNYLDVAMFQPNALWELVETKSERHSIVYPCCPEPYISVTISLTFERGLAWSSAAGMKALSLPALLVTAMYALLSLN